MQAIIDWVVHLMEVLGAPGVGVAILLENLFPPIPSEVVLPLAGFTVSQGSLHFITVLLWSVIGSVVGAYMLYGIGAWLGADRLRAIARRMWLVTETDVDASLDFFSRYGTVSVLFGRLVPGIRSLISIPAGLNHMSLVSFGVWTALGSTVWNAILIGLGFYLGESWHIVGSYVDSYSAVVYVIVGLIVAGLLGFAIRRAIKERRQAPAGTSDTTK